MLEKRVGEMYKSKIKISILVNFRKNSNWYQYIKDGGSSYDKEKFPLLNQQLLKQRCMKSTFSRNIEIEISVELKNTHSWKAKPIDSTSCFSIYEAMETFETWVIQYQRDIGTPGWISLDYPDSLTFITTRPSRFKRGRRLFLSSGPSNRSIVLPLNHPRISLLLLICFSFLPFLFFTAAYRVRIHPRPKNSLWKLLHDGENPWGWI